MTKVVSLIIMVVVAVVGTAAPGPQHAEFDREQLSVKGRAAYDRLFSACVFRVGPVGYAATTSTEELALYDLLDEPRAVEALKSLVAAGSYEAGLYGLVGLSVRNNAEFNRAVYVYNARQNRPERPKTNALACDLIDRPEYVTTQVGCIILAELRAQVVTDIQSGRYDQRIARQYRPRR